MSWDGFNYLILCDIATCEAEFQGGYSFRYAQSLAIERGWRVIYRMRDGARMRVHHCPEHAA